MAGACLACRPPGNAWPPGMHCPVVAEQPAPLNAHIAAHTALPLPIPLCPHRTMPFAFCTREKHWCEFAESAESGESTQLVRGGIQGQQCTARGR